MERRRFLLGAAGAALLPAAAAAAGDRRPGTGPWKLDALRRPPAHEAVGTEEVTERAAEGEVKVRLDRVLYAGEPWRGKPTRVFAYYARPFALPERRLPAMVLVHGGGGTAFPEWARLWAARGYAALAMDLAGKGEGRKPLPDGGPDQDDEWKFRRLGEGLTETWPYHAVAAVVRAAALLRSFPEVDRNRLGITGISWGGYLTCLAMSLEDRFRAAVPVYGCGYLHENSVWLPIFASLPAAEREAWIENFDPSRYLARCRTPSLWVNGTNDFAYPLDSYQKSYRAVRGPRQLCVTVNMPHGHQQGWAPKEIHLFTDSLFRPRSPGIPLVGQTALDGGKLRAAYESRSPLLRCEIHWTADLDRRWQERRWKTAPGRVVGLHEVEAPLPGERPCIAFATLRDNQGAVASTEHYELR